MIECWYNQNIRDREHRQVMSKAQTSSMETQPTSTDILFAHAVVLLQLTLCGVGGTLLVLTKYNLPWCCFCTSNQCRYSICTFAIYMVALLHLALALHTSYWCFMYGGGGGGGLVF